MVMVLVPVPVDGLIPELEPGGGADVEAGAPLPPAHPAVPSTIRTIPSVESLRPAFMAHHP
jgi:hypothetical protein